MTAHGDVRLHPHQQGSGSWLVRNETRYLAPRPHRASVLYRNIHADIDVSGAASVVTRNARRSVYAKLERGDVLMVAVLDRIGRRSLDVMGKVYDFVNRGVRLLRLADNKAWAKGLDADLESMERMTATLIAQVRSFSAQLEHQAIARRTRAGLARARAEGKQLAAS